MEQDFDRRRLAAFKTWASAWIILWLSGLVLISSLLVSFLHTYRHWLKDLGRSPAEVVSSLSLISRSIAFPLIGLQDYSDSSHFWFYAFWSILYLVPIFCAISVLRAQSRAVIVDRLVHFWLPYFAFLLIAIVAIGYGLWAPFHALL